MEVGGGVGWSGRVQKWGSLSDGLDQTMAPYYVRDHDFLLLGNLSVRSVIFNLVGTNPGRSPF